MGGQRRYVTLLFSDISGSSQHAESLEAEEYSELLARFRQFARDIIPHHGGSIARLQGDGLLALFGHQEPREDDGRRAVEAALALHAAVAALHAGTSAMRLHSGIHAGLVLLIEGDIERGRVDVVGEVPNTAARLCSLAGPGELLASLESLGPQAHFFQTTPPRRIPIRGRSAPLEVLRIDGQQAVVARRIDAAARRGTVAFVGREAPLARLLQCAAQAQAGQPAALLLSGEPGIGKTRLIEEFRRRLDPQQFRVLQGYCESYLGAEPLQPFVQALRETLAEQGGEAAGALRASALVEEFARLASQPRPLVLVLDDWQWADDASRHVLECLRERGLPLFLLLAARPFNEDDHALVGTTVLRLPPLADQEVLHAIGGWLPDANPFIAQAIAQRAGGSPLFIEELCHAAAAGSDEWARPRGAGGIAWINALVASRYARLPEPLAQALRAAAVAGTAFPRWLLERLWGAHETPALLEQLIASDFLLPAENAGMVRFKHGLTREAVYAIVDPANRRQLHLRIAQALEEGAGTQGSGGRGEGGEALEALSYHYDGAGVGIGEQAAHQAAPRKAAHYAELAGDRALATMALDRARAQYQTALRALDGLPALSPELKLRWCSIAQRLGQTCVFDPLDVAHSFEQFERAAQLARESGDDNALARAEYWLGYVNYGKGRPRRAAQHCEQALTLARASGDHKLAAQVQATLAQALASAGQYERAMPLFAQAVESKRAQSHPGSSTAIGSAYTLGRMGYTLGDLGRFAEAEAHFEQALTLLGDKVHSVRASVLELQAAAHLWQGRWDAAQASAQAGAELALRCRSRYLTAMGHALGACGGWAGRQDQAALQTLRDSTRWIEARGGAVSTSLNYGWLVDACLQQGLEAEARGHAAWLMRRARAHDRHGLPQGARALARWAAAKGRPALAGHYLALAERVAQARGSARERALNQLARAELAAQAGRGGEARALAEQAAAALERMAMAWQLGLARTLLARL